MFDTHAVVTVVRKSSKMGSYKGDNVVYSGLKLGNNMFERAEKPVK